LDTKEFIQKLKQSNISVDAGKTKQRVREVWKAASKAQQNAILASSGVKRTTLQRAYTTGNISAKLAVPIAQTLNLSPKYLTGEHDEVGEYSDIQLIELLREHKYTKLLKEIATNAPAKKPRQKPPVETVEAAPASFVEIETVVAPVLAEAPAFAGDLTEDEVILLVKSLLLKAKAGGKHAAAADQLKALLLA
jgi:hypothetical protein